MRRSRPGLGRIVGIYYLNLPAGPDPAAAPEHWVSSIGEDFADSDAPLVVKAKAEVTREQMVRYLRELLQDLEVGHLFRSIDEDKTPPPHPPPHEA